MTQELRSKALSTKCFVHSTQALWNE